LGNVLAGSLGIGIKDMNVLVVIDGGLNQHTPELAAAEYT